MNPYEQKQEAKRQRLQERATKKREEADSRYNKGKHLLSFIEFGQPILVGHYSEKGDRAYRARAVGHVEKSFVLSDEAKRLEEKADAVGSGGISSDDPDAVQKLDAKLAELIEVHARMVEGNKEARANGQPKPYMTYQLTNSNANIRRVQQRIRQLDRLKVAPVRENVVGNGWKMHEDKDENRIMFTFDAIPSEEIRHLMKSYAFLWSPYRKAWVRKITGNARFATDQLITKLAALTTEFHDKN